MNNLSDAINSLSSFGSEPNPVSVLVVFAVLGVLPFVFMATSSFVKLNVVLQIVRSALGAGQVPSTALITLLAFALSVKVMSPVYQQIYDRFQYLENQSEGVCESDKEELSQTEIACELNYVLRPLKEFLHTNSNEESLALFGNWQESSDSQVAASNVSDVSWSTLVPAFLISELRLAFVIGVSLFIPFLVVDLVVANVLVGMGMMMVSPNNIALPIKLVLFLASDAWVLLCQSLMAGYQ